MTEDEEYLEFIRRQPCLICGCWPVDPHHAGLRSEHQVGLGQKPPDLTALPLCRIHHREWHDHGRLAFVVKYDLDIASQIQLFNDRWNKDAKRRLQPL